MTLSTIVSPLKKEHFTPGQNPAPAFKGTDDILLCGRAPKEPCLYFCLLSAADCQSLGWAQPGIPGVEYPHLATWDAKDWRGVCFLLLPSINVTTEVESQLERMEADIPKRQTAK